MQNWIFRDFLYYLYYFNKMAGIMAPGQFLFAHFTKVQAEELLKLTDVDVIKKHLKEAYKVVEEGEKQALLMNFHYNNFKFCKSQDFTLEKFSTLMSILNFVFHESLSNNLDIELSRALFQELVIKHSIQRPPYSIEIFKIEERDTIFQQVELTFYRHYLLYKYIFAQQIDVMIACHVKGETPPPTPVETPMSGKFTDFGAEAEEDVESDLDEDGEDEVKNELKAFGRTLVSGFEETMKKNDEELTEKVSQGITI